jgi:hypothetical protein
LAYLKACRKDRRVGTAGFDKESLDAVQ